MTKKNNNKIIAKNTMFLYFRMLFSMVVALYTSRIVIKVLGVEEYGLYVTVGGIVGFLTFVNGALGNGSSRFLTFALGTGDKEQLSRTFSTVLIIHFVIAVLIVAVAEIAGLWFLHNKLIIAPNRIEAAVFVFHLSVLTAAIATTQVPYTASIIANEEMAIYAYVSVVEVLAKLPLVYILSIGNVDKLKLYAVLLCILQISLMLFYRFYCTKHFNETKFHFVFDRSLFKSIAGFSGWSLFAASSIALNTQGILILLNMFFSPSVVAARAISLQVNGLANQFVTNFRTAVNPQIVKHYAAQNYEKSKQLLLVSTKYSYFLMLILSLPVCLLAEPLLNLWLTAVPDYTVIYLQIVVIQSLFQVFDSSFYTALYAKGQLRENALISPMIGFVMFPIVYILFKAGFSPVALSWSSLICYAVLGLIIKPILLIKIAEYHWKDILAVFIPCLLVTTTSIPIPILIIQFINKNTAIGFILIGITAVLSVATSVYFFGFDKKMRVVILNEVVKKMNNISIAPSK
jgi:O-antigen/teichoic acid export membrane protein